MILESTKGDYDKKTNECLNLWNFDEFQKPFYMTTDVLLLLLFSGLYINLKIDTEETRAWYWTVIIYNPNSYLTGFSCVLPSFLSNLDWNWIASVYHVSCLVNFSKKAIKDGVFMTVLKSYESDALG